MRVGPAGRLASGCDNCAVMPAPASSRRPDASARCLSRAEGAAKGGTGGCVAPFGSFDVAQAEVTTECTSDSSPGLGGKRTARGAANPCMQATERLGTDCVERGNACSRFSFLAFKSPIPLFFLEAQPRVPARACACTRGSATRSKLHKNCSSPPRVAARKVLAIHTSPCSRTLSRTNQPYFGS